MSSNIYYNSIQQTSPYNYQYYQQQQHNAHYTSPISQIPTIPTYSTPRLNASYHQVHHSQTPIPISSLSSNQATAYFLDRIDLENYTTQILKKTVEEILSKTKSKGLKVKLSLPDDGLVIDNITDPNQSWIFKTSELLYFWRDLTYSDIIVVVTVNRSLRHPSQPYSASIFRLRGTTSAQSFIQRAQQVFGNLSVSRNTPKPIRNQSVDKFIRPEAACVEKSLSVQSPPQTVPIHRVTRAEFDPGKARTESLVNASNQRTYSETASSIDSHASQSTKEILLDLKKLPDDEEDKMTTVSNHFSADQIAELMRELKELRNEIAALKVEKLIPPMTRSMSTSPLTVHSRGPKQTIDSGTAISSSFFPEITSQSEADAETQTDFSLPNHRRRQLSRKNKKTMIGSSGISPSLSKKKAQQLPLRRSQKNSLDGSLNTTSDQEETSTELSSQPNGSTSVVLQERYQPMTPTPPRPILIQTQSAFMPLTRATTAVASYTISTSNPTEEGLLSHIVPVKIEKEAPKFLSTITSSSNVELSQTSIPIITSGPVSFRSSLEIANSPLEHIYENVPISIQPKSNGESFYNIPIINLDDQKPLTTSDNYTYYTVTASQQYLLPGQTVSNASPSTVETSSEPQSSAINNQPPQKSPTVSSNRHRNQPVYFANHLTNPVFNIDKQLLTNTIANQFGMDLNSPQLQQLINNQHLFAARKRTFANMVWQLTPDEETALCSLPAVNQTDSIHIETVNTTGSSPRPILKVMKHASLNSNRRSISWDSALE